MMEGCSLLAGLQNTKGIGLRKMCNFTEMKVFKEIVDKAGLIKYCSKTQLQKVINLYAQNSLHEPLSKFR